MYQYFFDVAHGAGALKQLGPIPIGTPILIFTETDLRSLPEMELALRLTIGK